MKRAIYVKERCKAVSLLSKPSTTQEETRASEICTGGSRSARECAGPAIGELHTPKRRALGGLRQGKLERAAHQYCPHGVAPVCALLCAASLNVPQAQDTNPNSRNCARRHDQHTEQCSQISSPQSSSTHQLPIIWCRQRQAISRMRQARHGDYLVWDVGLGGSSGPGLAGWEVFGVGGRLIFC